MVNWDRLAKDPSANTGVGCGYESVEAMGLDPLKTYNVIADDLEFDPETADVSLVSTLETPLPLCASDVRATYFNDECTGGDCFSSIPPLGARVFLVSEAGACP